MAITLQQFPPSLSPVYNDCVFIFSSDNVAQPNFQYVIDIYEGATFLQRMLVPPHPIHLTGKVNIAPILESYVSQDIDTSLSDNGVEVCSNSYMAYTLSVGEYYGSTPTIYPNLLATGNSVWNGILDYLDYCNLPTVSYSANTSNIIDFYTSRPSGTSITSTENAWLYWAKEEGNPDGRVKIITYDSSNNVIATRYITGPALGMYRVNSGPANLNDISSGSIESGGVQPIITNSVAKYTIQVLDTSSGSSPITTVFEYNIVNNCSVYEQQNIVFKNKLGGYDSFAFTLASRKSLDIERKTYKKGLGNYEDSNSFVYSPSDRAVSQFYTKIKDKVSIQSDWISEDVSDWLEELITSPDVYLNNGTNLIPINISNPNYERNQTVNKKLFNLTLDYTFSFDRYRQRI